MRKKLRDKSLTLAMLGLFVLSVYGNGLHLRTISVP
jgi:hypothetical protein